ncbi:MAG: type II toxin-antitoxin system RelE/ParE family toxin [Coriobacteriales bacterium]|jgi:mRNA interferase RelE/StbE|nr:type II toxin-antitoxin system RelE/ParE family toxin [Coriobacteriales bacterium]
MKSNAYTVVIEKKVAKELRKIEQKQQEIILSWIENILDGCADPYDISGAKRLQGIENGVRYRIGKYRILARIDNTRIVISVFRIGHRNDVYRNVT